MSVPNLIDPKGGNTSRKIKVLIVDDSLTIRRLLRLVLASDPAITVVGEAENPIEAREKIKQTDPDVLTLDVEMPRMDGLEFLSRLMRLRPMPVVMISTLTHKGSEFAINALALGAIEVFGKPAGPDPNAWQAIIPLVKTAARARVGRAEQASSLPEPRPTGRKPKRAIAIGASTGGVDAIETLLAQFPADCPPTLIVQHMPALFLESLVKRLNQKFAPDVALATHGEQLVQGTVYFAPGGANHLRVCSDGVTLSVESGEKVSGHRPSVDVLFTSLVENAPNFVACILTGMGKDGAKGMTAFRKAGGETFAQDEASSVVFGMPKAAIEAGAVSRVVPLKGMADVVLKAAMTHAARPSKRAALGA